MDFTRSRKKYQTSRRSYLNPSTTRANLAKPEPDILQIWEQQRRMREREAQLEREYELAKAHLRRLKIEIRKNNSLLADVADLDSSIYEDLREFIKKCRLWVVKSVKIASLKFDIFYTKLRHNLKIPASRRKNFWPEKIILFIFLVSAVSWLALWNNKTNPNDVNQATVHGQTTIANSPILLNQKPEFKVLTPAGAGADRLGGFAKINPPGTDSVYAFADRVDGVLIKVSQQQLPQKFKNDPSSFNQMAEAFNANRTINVSGKDVYIGSSESGPQSILFIKDSLLVLITSESAISDQSWINYISNLSL